MENSQWFPYWAFTRFLEWVTLWLRFGVCGCFCCGQEVGKILHLTWGWPQRERWAQTASTKRAFKQKHFVFQSDANPYTLSPCSFFIFIIIDLSCSIHLSYVDELYVQIPNCCLSGHPIHNFFCFTLLQADFERNKYLNSDQEFVKFVKQIAKCVGTMQQPRLPVSIGVSLIEMMYCFHHEPFFFTRSLPPINVYWSFGGVERALFSFWGLYATTFILESTTAALETKVSLESLQTRLITVIINLFPNKYICKILRKLKCNGAILRFLRSVLKL